MALVDLEQRAHAAEAPEDVAVDVAVAAHRRAARLHTFSYLAYTVAVLSLVSGCLLGREVVRLFFGAAVLALLAGWAVAWVARLAERDAKQVSERAGDHLAETQMAREAREAREALLASEDGRWLRELIARHPTLAWGDVQPPAGPYRDSPPG